jgi:regulator of replication initiation timing
VLVVQYEQALASTQSEIHKIKSTYESMSHEEITLKADNRRLWKELKHTLAVYNNNNM